MNALKLVSLIEWHQYPQICQELEPLAKWEKLLISESSIMTLDDLIMNNFYTGLLSLGLSEGWCHNRLTCLFSWLVFYFLCCYISDKHLVYLMSQLYFCFVAPKVLWMNNISQTCWKYICSSTLSILSPQIVFTLNVFPMVHVKSFLQDSQTRVRVVVRTSLFCSDLIIVFDVWSHHWQYGGNPPIRQRILGSPKTFDPFVKH